MSKRKSSKALQLLVISGIVCSCVLGGARSAAQPAPLASIEVAVSVDSGLVSNRLSPRKAIEVREPAVVFSKVVAVAGAPWIRLRFGGFQLSGSHLAGTESFIRITSLKDGAVQILNASTLVEWGLTSCYFNGDSVLVELLARPITGASRIVIDGITAGVRGVAFPESICGATDDRVPVVDPRVARIMPVGCTAFLIGQGQGCFLSAGHCADAFSPTEVVQFNVPASNPDGTPNMPSPQDQYAIDPASVQYAINGPGDDWAFFGAFANSVTGLTPREAQGGAFLLASAPPVPDGTAIQITGYGTDSTPPEFNQTLQTDIGTYDTLNGTVIEYNDLDTEPGNSGSPILHVSMDRIIGIHTNGGCSSPGFGNAGTAINNTGLQTALANPQGICAVAPFDEAISRAFTVMRLGSGPNQGEAVSRAFTVMRFGSVIAFNEAISRAFTVIEVCRLGDLNADGAVDSADLAMLLANWGPGSSVADLNNDGAVDAADLATLLANWGLCP